MDLSKNYYSILGISKSANDKEIKKSYYKLSFINHPDKGGDPIIFGEMTEAYDILLSEKRLEYDTKSIWGASYDENSSLFDFELNNMAKSWDEEKLNDWINKNQLNILIYIDNNFNGNIEYERWVICKSCGGDGKDTKSKIQIKDDKGNIKFFEGSDGCDFCEGSGKNWNGDSCYFCGGKGMVGWTDCKSCNGKRIILGKQKLTGIKIPIDEKAYELKNMGHFSQYELGKSGSIWLIRK